MTDWPDAVREHEEKPIWHTLPNGDEYVAKWRADAAIRDLKAMVEEFATEHEVDHARAEKWKARAEKAEAKARKWEWVARNELVSTDGGETWHGEPRRLYVDSLAARYEAEHDA